MGSRPCTQWRTHSNEWANQHTLMSRVSSIQYNIQEYPWMKKMQKYLTIEKLSRCECTATALRPLRRGNDLGACYLRSLYDAGAS